MYLKYKVLLTLGPLYKKLNVIALILCLVICVNFCDAGRLPLLKRDTSRSSSIGLSTAEPQNIEINLGLNHKTHQTEKVPAQSNVVINCNIERLQGWHKNNENLNVEQKSLTLKSIKKIDSGLYSCKSIDGEQFNVTLMVTPVKKNNKDSLHESTSKKLHFTNTSSMHSLMKKNVGDSVQFHCAVEDPANTVNSKLTWTKNGKPLNRSEPIYFTKTSLQIEKLTIGDLGQYTCHICNVNSCINFTTTLDILEAGEKNIDQLIENLVDERSEKLNNNNNNTDVGTDGSEGKPYFSKPESMDSLVAKPSGNMVRLACNAKGNPEPTLSWTKDNQTINREIGAPKYRKFALILEDLVPSDSGSYKCMACNENGCIEHSTRLYVNARMNYPPFITQAPENLTLMVGSSGVIECTYYSDNHSESKWIKGKCDNCTGKKILQTDSEILRLDNVTIEDEGWYTCYVANSIGTSAASAYLAVLSELPAEPVKIPMRPKTISLKNLTIGIGGSGRMNCEYYSIQPAKLHWIKGTCINCTEDNILPGLPENPEVLRIQNVTLDDEGWYTCYVNSSISASAYLTVVNYYDYISPRLVTEFDNLKGNTLAGLNILNNIKNYNDGYVANDDDDDEDLYLEPEFREPKNKTTFTEPNNYLSEHNQDDINSTNLENGQEEDEDMNNDLSNKSYGEDDESTGMAPYFSKPESMDPLVAKPSGNMVRLACNAKGNPEPTLSWTKDNQTINRQMGAAKYRKFALILEDLVPSDSGSYKCMACNENGCIEHSTRLYVNARMNHPPFITQAPENLTLVVGSSGVIKCTYYSDNHSESEWIKGKCDNCTGKKILQSDSDNPEILRLDNVTFEDEGWYTCYAANSLGTSAASAYLAVVSELPADPVKLPMRGLPVWLLILIITLASSFIVAVGVMCVIFKKLQIEKQNKNLNLEKVNMVTKKIIIVKPNSYNTNGGGTTESIISFPIVKIEKHRSVMLQNSNCEQSFESEYEFPIDEDWEITRSKLTLGRPLGEGEFGRVMMAEARDLFKPGSKTIVAVKMLKDGHTDQDVSDLVSEMELMKMIGKHINIINLLGCCTQDGPLHVIVEYAPHGNLRDFLKSNRLSHDNSDPLIQKKCFTEKELVSYAYQAARGMEYLASRRCVHRDLAARNVLVGEDYIIKIADFGLARDIHAQDYYRKNSDGRLPIKWMAPESLMYKKYDSKSDVWSYGILLWEIMSLGATPYPYMAKYTKMITTLQSGYRMEKPEYCSMDIYTLMRECWNFRPDQRPNFSEIVKDLDQILSRTSDKEYLDLGLPELETPPSSENESDTDTEEL